MPVRGDQVCINGGPISKVEQAEMPMIVRAATLDAQKSGVQCAIDLIKTVSFKKFCEVYGTGVLTTEAAQLQSDNATLVRELEQLRVTYKAEAMALTQSRDKIVQEKEHIDAEYTLLKAQLGARDKELAKLRYLGSGNTGTSVDQQPAVQPVLGYDNAFGDQSERVGDSSVAAANRTEPGYMELLGWTVKRGQVGQGRHQSNDLWERIFNYHADTISTRNAGELMQDSELLYQYASIPKLKPPQVLLVPANIFAFLLALSRKIRDHGWSIRQSRLVSHKPRGNDNSPRLRTAERGSRSEERQCSLHGTHWWAPNSQAANCHTELAASTCNVALIFVCMARRIAGFTRRVRRRTLELSLRARSAEASAPVTSTCNNTTTSPFHMYSSVYAARVVAVIMCSEHGSLYCSSPSAN